MKRNTIDTSNTAGVVRRIDWDAIVSLSAGDDNPYRRAVARLGPAFFGIDDAGVAKYAANARTMATRKRYASAWQTFMYYCAAHGEEPLPTSPMMVAQYVSYLADGPTRPLDPLVLPDGHRLDRARRVRPLHTNSIMVHVAAIAYQHWVQGYEDPTASNLVRKLTLVGLRSADRSDSAGRDLGVYEQKEPIDRELLIRLLERTPYPGTATEKRDHALLLLMFFSGGRRRSEIASLRHHQVRFDAQGVVIQLWRSKTNRQERVEEYVAPYDDDERLCAGRCLAAWFEEANIIAGDPAPIFRYIDRHGNIRLSKEGLGLSAKAVAQIVKDRVAAAGVDPDRYGAHSLRHGFVKTARDLGIPDREIMRDTGHASMQSLSRYGNSHERWAARATMKLGVEERNRER